VPSSRYGWSVSIAPLKKKNALLSSSEPANSSMLNGPALALEPSSFEDAEADEQRGRLLHTDVVVVERDVEVDVLAVADEAVVGDDRDAGVAAAWSWPDSAVPSIAAMIRASRPW
jgi:hypothetical protein